MLSTLVMSSFVDDGDSGVVGLGLSQLVADRVPETQHSLFRNKRFALNEMFQQNASKFAIFYV